MQSAIFGQPVVAISRSGRLAHGLHPDLSKAIGPWVKFASADVLEKAITYLGATTEELEEFRDAMRRWGQGSSALAIQPNKKNLLRLDYKLL
ncbi:MAG: hypothetical protein JWQ49_2785 [Edaphobacter sp.]|nr:hypothetical protein [Edaphobacter sp.]